MQKFYIQCEDFFSKVFALKILKSDIIEPEVKSLMEVYIKEAIKIIKEELHKGGIRVLKICLFDSRAKRTFKKDSDCDFFAIVDRKMDFNEK